VSSARTKSKVAAYNLLVCMAIACLGAVLTSIWGPAAGLLYIAVLACAAPLGRMVWP
jgi:hypothetical protein